MMYGSETWTLYRYHIKLLEEGSRKIGRPILRYKDNLKDLLKRGAALGTWKEIVTDWLAWRRL